MKFWKKIFISSVILCIVIFNSASVILIESMHNEDLDNEIFSAMNEYENIISSIYFNFDNSNKFNTYNNSNYTTKKSLTEWLSVAIKSSINPDNINFLNIEIFDKYNNFITSVFNNRFNVNSRTEVINSNVDDKKFIIRNIKNKKILFISKSVNLSKYEFKLVLSKNITSLYTQRINSYKLFITVDIIFSTLLAICMYYISRQLTKPIETLSDTSISIANGDYSKRIDKISNDEFGVLANNFNTMVESLQNNIDKLDAMNSDKQKFIDNLNHEIKTPITSIIGYSELLLNANIDEDVKLKCLQYIHSESKRLASLNSSLLRLTLLKQDELDFENIQLNDLIMFVSNSLDVRLKEKSIDLQIDVSNYIFVSDWDLMSILIINILENAIKASHFKGIIKIKLNDLDQLQITDFGEGVPASDLDKIKQPFYMVDKSRDRKKNGLGLGLSICNQICDRLNITFNIDSKLKFGTTVTIDISKGAFNK